MTKEDIELSAVSEYINSSLSLSSVAKKYGYTGGWLLKKLNAKGIRPRGRADWKLNVEKETLACQYYRDNMPVKEIASKFSISRRTVTEWIKKNGIRPLNYNERLGVTQELKQHAVKLYVDDKLNCCEISKIIGFSHRSILDWVKDVKRSASEIASISSFNGKKKGYGKKGWVETRFGQIRYDSSYERDRILMLDKDLSVISLKRCPYLIKYTDTNRYNPDFLVQYNDNSFVVEEVKPYQMLKLEKNISKFKAANSYLKTLNIPFIIVTQKEIYGK
jgi:transposase